MKLFEWKQLRDKAAMGQLTEMDIELLEKDKIIEINNLEEEDFSVSSDTTEMGKGHQKVMTHPSIPSTSPEILEENKKAGFSNAILLAIISFVAEILFIGFAFFLFK